MLSPGIEEAFSGNRAKVAALPGVAELAATATAPGAAKTQGRPSVATTTAANFIRTPAIATEAFGPFTVVLLAEAADEFVAAARTLEGQLTATVHGNADDFASARPLLALLEQKAGRVLLNSFPTGVEVSPAMNHGGPSPATSDVRFTSVGTAAMLRFARPICYQGFLPALLPPALQNENPLKILRLVNGQHTRDPIA